MEDPRGKSLEKIFKEKENTVDTFSIKTSSSAKEIKIMWN